MRVENINFNAFWIRGVGCTSSLLLISLNQSLLWYRSWECELQFCGRNGKAQFHVLRLNSAKKEYCQDFIIIIKFFWNNTAHSYKTTDLNVIVVYQKVFFFYFCSMLFDTIPDNVLNTVDFSFILSLATLFVVWPCLPLLLPLLVLLYVYVGFAFIFHCNLLVRLLKLHFVYSKSAEAQKAKWFRAYFNIVTIFSFLHSILISCHEYRFF